MTTNRDPETSPVYRPGPEDLIDDVLSAQAALKEHQDEAKAVERMLLVERGQAIRTAIAGGVAARKLMEVLGVNRSRVYQMGDAAKGWPLNSGKNSSTQD